MDFSKDPSSLAREYARNLDEQDPLRDFRKEFIIPSKADLTRPTLAPPTGEEARKSEESCVYLCGNSLGLQPVSTSEHVNSYLRSWALKGVLGHTEPHTDQLTAEWLNIDDRAPELMAPLVGAKESEVALMGTLTGNLHLLMASFYKPTKERYKIIFEGKAFPSDHFAIESQARHHGLDPEDAMVLIEPVSEDYPVLETSQILSVIDAHADTAALILLPGIQYYTGQFFDMKTITAHAHSKGLMVGWDCAHAVGNVELQFHDWDVDFAVWCSYKYLNSGAGAMAGLFVHEKHGLVTEDSFRPRLSGWWGSDKSSRFIMDNKFVPRPGAAGYQVSNPSALDLAAVTASLKVFNRATMQALRRKSVKLTAYLEYLIDSEFPSKSERPFTIITPSDPDMRGAQLSLRLKAGLLDPVFSCLLRNGVVLDERRPDVIRVAPAPLYNSFEDVWLFVRELRVACDEATAR
ncbi:Kynureninase [Trichophyton interdigitale]|uniref:Kynureninase n=1 Tax=Trichophyton interdigitale TaxID=101480 RepID=A0A9P4YH77_9EURO|nr:Kynureninase [Trichophyton interdigitale]KAF3894581.1 Kynureninase [Trichophyton interdigitale]KAG8208469.1 Kynureninase [Trichophyton interdigitale]